jgi:hypothetical protein
MTLRDATTQTVFALSLLVFRRQGPVAGLARGETLGSRMYNLPVPSEPALYKPMMIVLWLLPVLALTAAVFVIVGREQVGRKLSWLMAAVVAVVSAASVITLIATWGNVSSELQGIGRSVFWIVVISFAGVTTIALSSLLLDRRLSAAEFSPDKPVREDKWRAALVVGGLLTLLPQAILPFLALDSSGALMGGLIFFVYSLYYDVLAVTAVGAAVYRLAHAATGVSVKAATWTRVAAISVGGLAVLLQIVVVVILWAADLSKTPTSFLS